MVPTWSLRQQPKRRGNPHRRWACWGLCTHVVCGHAQTVVCRSITQVDTLHWNQDQQQERSVTTCALVLHAVKACDITVKGEEGRTDM
jgi:hypothetical protein